MQDKTVISSNIVGIARRLKDAGTSSREKGLEKRAKALSLVYRWGWSSPTLVDDFVSPGRRGLVKRLVEQLYLKSYPNPAGGGDKSNPRNVVCLTDKGQSFVEGYLQDRGELLSQRFHDDIPWRTLRHDYIVQKASLDAIKADRIKDALSPKQLLQKSRSGIKQPDSIWILENGSRVAVELELNRKKKGLEESLAVAALVNSISAEPGDGKVDMVFILSPSPAILDSYSYLLRANRSIRLYEKNIQKNWVESGTLVISDSVSQRFRFQKIEP